ncbi:peptidase [Streptococcaceae bacterium ESL0687]|nr:peptidase [Streptococcaceae bacterium ESL0687]
MNKIIEEIKNFIPSVRVNNRDLNIEFYRQVFGLKNLYEENSIAVFGGHVNKSEKFILEESPATRTRAVSDGIKKLKRLVIKADPCEITELIKLNSKKLSKIYKGEKGYAFEAISPENDLVLIHGEDDSKKLEEIDLQLESLESLKDDFKGLSDYEIAEIDINVLNVSEAMDFYSHVFGVNGQENTIELPFIKLNFFEAEGKDLQAEFDQTWDLEIFEFKVPTDFDLREAAERFEEMGYDCHVNKQERILTMTDKSGIENWIMKDKVKV